MSERGSAADLQDRSPAVGEQPTLAATDIARPEQQAGSASGPRRNEPIPEGEWTGHVVGGRYLILDKLGEGGMGVVYVAEHVHLKKRVAFKVIHPDLAAHEELLLRFKREALATGQLDHPHIAAAIDFGELEGGGAFMVMPLVRGHSLQQELDKNGKLEPRRAARLGAQIADALSAAHEVGIVHRDLKPDNVLLEPRSDGSEAAKVLDFGVASPAGRPEGLSVDARPLTQAGTILGTPGYMSPEQASAGEVDHRTDLYALGVILWELCRGERLFEGSTITEIFSKQFKTQPAALDLGLSPSSRELSALVARLLAWDKAARPGSATEVRDALRRIAQLPESRLSSFTLPDIRSFRLPDLGSLKPYRRHISATVVGLVLFLFFSLRSDDGAQLAPEAEPGSGAVVTRANEPRTVAAREARKEREEREARKEREEREARAAREKRDPGDEPTIADEHPPEPRAVRTTPLPPLPSVFAEPSEQLLTSKSRETRRSVAKRITRSRGVPRFLALAAELELTDRCAEKKEVIGAMRNELDPRVLPALERMAEQPKHGCGLLRMTDCLSCLRRDLDQTIGVLQHASSP
jgi:eukaryotic-like serine/threonine-protein kinase